ncbi:cation diffusion facilitator family transporter [Aquibacillus koreensis]|uniref:Cation diffusion facilitator family transporter n=1 Tax=Aquibacillus koreensis TaxID=279446 RepID=A0A9X3WKC3_9BACI|nr:cation diffusion facilitator family transporter [Aquibacillus koreensis]MCT2535757.1 cation diffusion facilitator family transporter [Aquibacillus koreensis]MDC3420213.1 cation diffusion facilitator family transporter [Aquibacillus koreensis]
MGHEHSHDHHHGHNHHHGANKKALFISFILIASFMVVEVIGGLVTNSLALLSDAGHMLSDAAALGLSLLAIKIGEKASSSTKTFGYKRLEILAAFINGLTLLAISLYIFWEAYHRFLEPPNVSGGMLFIAIIGLIVNIVVAWILMQGDTHGNLNMRSAFLHVMGDLLGSVGAIIAGLLIIFLGWNIADPIASVIVAILILISGWRVTKDSFHVLMEGKPSHIDLKVVEEKLLSFPGVKNVHDLHIWTITSDFPTLSCHLVVKENINRDDLLHEISHVLQDEFHLKHTTIQMEGETSKIQEHEQSCN